MLFPLLLGKLLPLSTKKPDDPAGDIPEVHQPDSITFCPVIRQGQPVVYLVYGRESSRQDANMLAIASWLQVTGGCEVILDLTSLTQIGRQGFGPWFDVQMTKANCVIVVFTHVFVQQWQQRRRNWRVDILSDREPDASQGKLELVQSEMDYLRKLMRNRGMKRVAVVVLGDNDISLPPSLAGIEEHLVFDLCRSTEDWERLHSYLHTGTCPRQTSTTQEGSMTDRAVTAQNQTDSNCNANRVCTQL